MTTIETSARVRTLINRVVEVHWNEFKTEGERLRHNQRLFKRAINDGGCEYRQMSLVDDIIIIFEFGFTFYHDDICEKDDVVEYDDEECLCEKEVDYRIIIRRSNIICFEGGFSKNKTTLEVLEYFKTMPDQLVVCQCGDLATHGVWCQDCYIWRQEHPKGEVCAICHEGEGKYLKTECNHYFHVHCFYMITATNYVRPCPLCRHPVEKAISHV